MEFVRQEPVVVGGNVVSINLGATEVDGVYTAYVDANVAIPAEEQKALESWTQEELDTFSTTAATNENFTSILANQINNQKGANADGSVDYWNMNVISAPFLTFPFQE